MRDVSTSRPCERRDPSVSAIALIAAARTLVSALEQRPFFTFEARGDEARGDDGVDGPYGIAMCQNEVVANLRQGSRP